METTNVCRSEEHRESEEFPFPNLMMAYSQDCFQNYLKSDGADPLLL